MSTGTYSYLLKVWDSYGCRSDQIKNIDIFNRPMVSFSNTTSCAKAVTSFTGSAASSGSTINSWNWNFDDGGSSTIQSPGHNYAIGGTYNPILTVVDGRGCANSYTQQISVLTSPDVPIITGSPSTHNLCTGATMTLNATNIGGSNTIIWSANNYPSINNATTSSVNYTAPNTSSTETIGLKVTAINGCYTYATPYGLYTHDLDITINSNSSNNILCPGNSIQLSGFIAVPQQHYQWMVSTDGGANWANVGTDNQIYTATSAGWYKYEASNNFGCTKLSNHIIINAAGTLNISDNLIPSGFLSPPLNATISINTVNAPAYTQIQWYRNDIPIGTGTNMISTTLPGDYHVIALGCGIEKSNIKVINYDNNSGTWDPQYITGYTPTSSTNISSMPGSGFVIDGDIVINSGISLVIEAKINFIGCHRIIVNSGGSLTITNNSVISAGSQWEGIFVDNGGTLVINSNSDISNAVIGALSQDGGSINIQNSTFGRNIVHLAFDNYNLITPAYIGNNQFGHVIDAGTSLTCTGYTEYSSLNIPRGNQIFINGGALSRGITLINNTAWLTQTYTSNNNVWLSAYNNPDITLTVNSIKGFYNTAIKMEDCKTAVINGNQITALNEFDFAYACPCNPRGTGMYFKNTEQASISTNYLKRWRVGMEYYEDLNTSPTTTIQSNKFIDGIYGLVVAPVAYPVGSANSAANKAQWSNPIRLSITCNLFDGNEIGIVGSGQIPTQGTTSLSAGNRFNLNNVALNSIYSTLWNYSSPIVYYFSFGSNDDEIIASSPNFQVTIDGDQVDNSNNKLLGQQGNTNSLNPCTNSMFRSTNNHTSLTKINEPKGPKIYPNPTSSLLKVDDLDGNSAIKVYSADGSLVGEWTSDEKNVELSLDFLANGLYLLYITDTNGTAAFRFMKVSS